MAQNKPHIDEKLLIQFLLGEISSQEMHLVDEWLHVSEENQHQLDLLEKIWVESGRLTPNPVAVDMKKSWETLSLRVDEYEAVTKNKGGRVISFNQKIIRIAFSAAAILAIAFGLFKFVLKPNIPVNQLAFTATQNIFKGTLPDGSEIALNLNSKLSYPEKFDKKTRQVELEGEAFFQVAHNIKKPFIIKAGDAHIKVLGTSFSVKAIKGTDVEVSVATGKVQLFRVDSISGDTASVFLTAGQKGVLPNASLKPTKLDELVEPDELFWMDRTLVFKQIELSKVIVMLEKHYGVSITIENQMALNCKYTATFTNTEINDILDMMASTFNFALTSKNNSFVLKGNGCLDD